MSAGVVATFQPLAVSRFSWGSDQIAAGNFQSSSLSNVLSLIMAHLRLPERADRRPWRACSTSAPSSYAARRSPSGGSSSGSCSASRRRFCSWRRSAAFSRLMGGTRVTNSLTTALCLAPLIGAAVGTAFAPLLLGLAGTPWFVLAALPALVAVGGIMLGWRRLEVAQAGGGGAAGAPLLDGGKRRERRR